MKLSITSKALTGLLKRLGTVNVRGHTLPVLRCVHLSVESEAAGRIRGMMTNLDLTVEAWADVDDIGEAGAALVHAGRLAHVAGLAEGDAEMELSLDSPADPLRVRSGAWAAKLCGLSPDDMPPVPYRLEGPPAFEVPAGVLRRMLAVCLAVVSTDETRYILCGVRIVKATRPGGSVRLRAEATDGRRLVRAEVSGFGEVPDFDFVIPTAAAKALKALMDDGPEGVGVWLHAKGGGEVDSAGASPHPSTIDAVSFRLADGTAVHTKILAGNYPQTDKVIPLWHGGVSLERRALLSMVERAMVLAGDNKSVKLSFSQKGEVHAESGEADAGEWTEEQTLFAAAAKASVPRNCRVAVNGVFFAMLGAAESEEVQVGFDDKYPEANPMMFLATETTAGHGIAITWVLMPMRSAEEVEKGAGKTAPAPAA